MKLAGSLLFRVVAVAAALPAALPAAPFDIGAKTKLQHCSAGTCLRISGHRAEASAPVLVAGHTVAVKGARKWRVALPLETVRAWVPPFARTISVRVAGESPAEMKTRLPTGLLGHDIDLAYLDVRAPH